MLDEKTRWSNQKREWGFVGWCGVKGVERKKEEAKEGRKDGGGGEGEFVIAVAVKNSFLSQLNLPRLVVVASEPSESDGGGALSRLPSDTNNTPPPCYLLGCCFLLVASPAAAVVSPLPLFLSHLFLLSAAASPLMEFAARGGF